MSDPDISPSTADVLSAASMRALLGNVMHDPRHLPENLANFGVGRLGPAAAEQVRKVRAAHPEWDLDQCRAAVLHAGMRAAIPRGALIGGPLLALAPYGFCAALMAQNRIVLELAALAGRDPTAPERAAELLVLQDAFPDLEAARAGLAGARSAGGPRPPRVGKTRALWQATWRLVYLLGLVTRTQEGEHRDSGWLRALRWALLGATFLVSVVAPLIWMPYLADSYRQSTVRITQRAERFYFGTVTPVRHDADRHSRWLALASVLFTAGLVALALIIGNRLFDSTWLAVVVALVVGSVTGSWVGTVVMRRRLRRG